MNDALPSKSFYVGSFGLFISHSQRESGTHYATEWFLYVKYYCHCQAERQCQFVYLISGTVLAQVKLCY